MKLIDISNVNKSFGNQRVLDNLSMGIRQGEFLTILGPSGCGKSTLLRCIAGFETIDSGLIEMEGKDLKNVAPSDRKVGMIFQQNTLFPTMTVYENIAFGLSVKNVDKKTIDEKVKEALKMVELSESQSKYPGQLSGGEKQRASIARTLVTEPKVLLLDEPFSAIDAKLRKQLQYNLREIHESLGITSVFVTHDQNEAMILSDRICVMNNGDIVQTGTPSELYTYPKSQFVASFIGNYNILNHRDANNLNIQVNEDESVVIRPETIMIYPIESDYKDTYAKGRIYNLRFQTGLIIYEVIVDDKTYTVESLFTEETQYKVGDTVYLEVDKKQIIKLIK